MYWQVKTSKTERGYCVNAVRDDRDPEDESKWQQWCIVGKDCAIFECILEYYKEHPQHGLIIIEKKNLVIRTSLNI